jgi:Tfp pilus assembly pilus retraction ATPase PilT
MMLALAGWWACAVVWMRTIDWVCRDATKLKLTPAFWSTVVGLPYVLVALLVWWIPSAIACFVLLPLAWLIPLVVYVRSRNRGLPKSQRIGSVAHARKTLGRVFAPLGVEFDDDLDPEALLPKVEFVAMGGRDQAEDAARLEQAGSLPGVEAARKLFVDAVVARAETVMLEPAAEGMLARHQVDGVWWRKRQRVGGSRKDRHRWEDAAASSREEGLAIMRFLQALGCTKESKAAGLFGIKVDGKPRTCRIKLDSTPAGPRLTARIEAPDTIFKTLADLGMPEDTAAEVGRLLKLEKGLLLLSGPAGSGLTTTFGTVVQSADRLMRDFISIEDAAEPPRPIQNVKPVPYDLRTGNTPLDVLATAVRAYPNVIISRDIRDKELLTELVRQVDEDRLVIVSIAANDACDAVARVRACGIDADRLGKAVVGSLSQRVVRRLCPKCSEKYTQEQPPPPAMLQRLGCTPEEAGKLRKKSAEGCIICQGTGFVGRAAVFELASGTAFRRAIVAGSDSRQLAQVAAKEGMRTFARSARDLVVAGVTSYDEVLRVLAGPSAAKERQGAAT